MPPPPKNKPGRPRKIPKGKGKRYAVRFEVTGSYAHKRMLDTMRRVIDGKPETNQDIVRRLIEDEAARDPLGSGGSEG